MTEQVVSALTRRVDSDRALHIEDIQDQVELALMRGEHHKVARAYVLYREERARARREEVAANGRDRRRSVAQGPRGRRLAAAARRARACRRLIDEAVAGLDGASAEPVLTESPPQSL